MSASPEKSGIASEDTLPTLPRLIALKQGNMFVVADAYGDISGDGDGLFYYDTRMLSKFCLLLSDARPTLLSGNVSRDNTQFTANLTNRPLPLLGGRSTRKGVIHIRRTRFLWHARLYELIGFESYSEYPTTLPLSFIYGADFRDMFEVRGASRPVRGTLLPPDVGNSLVTLSYVGLDGVTRRTNIKFSERPKTLSEQKAEFSFEIAARGRRDLYIEIGDHPVETPGRMRFRAGMARASLAMRRTRRQGASFRTSGRLFNEWIERSRADLALLTTELPTGQFPYAGIPWFSTPFGRDAIITSLQMLWINPNLARGVLGFLAENQAKETSEFQDATPGKIMHEQRRGEMTNLRELPFGQYYGGVDTTPLFVMLAGAYAERTGDMAFIDSLWPHLLAAVHWIDEYGDSNRDGFVDYQASSGKGLVNQGWKDSEDSIFHADGTLATGDIALVEVQGYTYASFRAMSALAFRRGAIDLGTRWDERAESLRRAVEEKFWAPNLDYYAIALDGEARRCAVRASNPGHLLYCGLPTQARAEAVIRQLASQGFSSGWGIRTLATTEARYNPMSYHNGSVWPHDTALCSAGMARYGAKSATVRILSELFEAAVTFGMRMPELYCGFPRQPGQAPVDYPVACLPQAWSSGALFMHLQACLGIEVDGFSGDIHIRQPRLPIGVDHVTIKGLVVGEKTVDLEFRQLGEQVLVSPCAGDKHEVPLLVHV